MERLLRVVAAVSAETSGSSSHRRATSPGVVNPPGGKRTHRTDGGDTADADEWLERASVHKGTWWKDWARWMRQHSGRRGAAPAMGNDDYPPLCPAPGKYVLER